MQEIVSITNGTARHPDYRLAAPVTLTIYKGVPTAICGRNGAGKTFLADMLRMARPLCGDALRCSLVPPKGGHVADIIRYVSFRDVYGGLEPAYYQQRWNNGDEEVFPTVREVLAPDEKLNGEVSKLKHELFTAEAIVETLGLTPHLDKPVNLLSSGELRRLQLARVLGESPEWLIVDNPYIGLDAAAREMLTGVFEKLSARLTLMLVVSRAADIPAFIDNVIPVSCLQVEAPCTRREYLARHAHEQLPATAPIPLPEMPSGRDGATCNLPDAVIDFRNINISYGRRRLFDGFSWHVARGERWALTGRNGSGKTTLLSLVCADNPVAYACDISLFGRQRGTGESIWDIKKHIGYVSPEIYSTYRKNLTALEIAASGLHDTVGLYRRTTDEEQAHCRGWLKAFGAERLAERLYLTLSDGEQRLILLVRAFVKSPALLVLDEPFHGLDDRYRRRAMSVIDRYMADPTKTLIIVSHYEEELPSCINRRLRLGEK